MTGREAISGFQELSRRFRQGYKWGELEPIWPELLQCSVEAMVRATGIIMKNGKHRPRPAYVLSQVQLHQRKMLYQSQGVPDVAGVRDPDAEGREALALMKDYQSEAITRAEYIQALFSMSERHGQPGYAMQAHELEKRSQR